MRTRRKESSRPGHKDQVEDLIQEYPEVDTMLKKQIDRWNRLPVNVLYTAQTQRLEVEGETEDDEDVTLLLPSMGTKSGVLAQRVCAKTTLNGLLQVSVRRTDDGKRQERRRLMLRGSKRWMAKDRHLITPESGFIVNPNIAEMAAAADRKAKTGSGPDEDASRQIGSGTVKKRRKPETSDDDDDSNDD